MEVEHERTPLLPRAKEKVSKQNWRRMIWCRSKKVGEETREEENRSTCAKNGNAQRRNNFPRISNSWPTKRPRTYPFRVRPRFTYLSIYLSSTVYLSDSPVYESARLDVDDVEPELPGRLLHPPLGYDDAQLLRGGGAAEADHLVVAAEGDVRVGGDGGCRGLALLGGAGGLLRGF